MTESTSKLPLPVFVEEGMPAAASDFLCGWVLTSWSSHSPHSASRHGPQVLAA